MRAQASGVVSSGTAFALLWMAWCFTVPLPAAEPPKFTPEEQQIAKDAVAANEQAVKAFALGRYDDALRGFRRSRDGLQQLFPADKYPKGHPYLARNLNSIGRALQAKGALADAEDCYRQAIATYRILYPADRVPRGNNEFAIGLFNLGSALQEQGKLEAAEGAHREALEMRRKLYPAEGFPKGYPDVAASLTSLGVLAHLRGDYLAGEPLFVEALEIQRKLYPRDKYPQGHPDLATGLNNLGQLYKERGLVAQAEPLCRQAVDLDEKLYPATKFLRGHPDFARDLQGLGVVLFARGDRVVAEIHVRRALKMREALHPSETFPRGHPHLASCLATLGAMLQERGDLKDAESQLRRAADVYRKLYPLETYLNGQPDLARCLSQLGIVEYRRDLLAEAEGHFQQALAIERKLYPAEKYPRGHPELASTLCNLAWTFQAQGKADKAERHGRDALATCRKLYPRESYANGHPQLARNLAILGGLLQLGGQSDKAEDLYRQATRMNLALLGQFAALSSETDALNFAANLPVSRDLYLDVTRGRPSADEAYDLVWEGRGILMRLAARRHQDLIQSRDPRTRNLVADLNQVRAELTQLLTHPVAEVANQRRRLQGLAEKKETIERAIAQALRQEGPAADAASCTPADLRRALPGNAAFVDFLCYRRREFDPKDPGPRSWRWQRCYCAFVLTKERGPRRIELGEAEPIEQALNDWRREIDLGARLPRRGDADVRLSRLVWQPLVKHLPERCDVLYLCPDAGLTRLPWAALPGGRAGKVVLEEHAVAVVPHGVWLVEQLRSTPRPAHDGDLFLACGGVRYDQAPGAAGDQQPLLADNRERGTVARGATWDYLKGTEQEIQQVLARAGTRPQRVRRGPEASAARLLQDLPRARWAHLATHGFFDDADARSVLQLSKEDYFLTERGDRLGIAIRNPLLLSGLVLAGANRKSPTTTDTFDPDGGILTGDHLVGLRLNSLDLVVLSACNTGLGDVAGGEGVFGLQRAFHVAGTRNVVASLWQVEDESTPALMTLFYHHLWEKRLPPLQALRNAQLHLYYHPKEIATLAAMRGPKLNVVVEGPVDPPPTEKPSPEKPAGRALVKQWAGFVLSGAGK